MTKPFNPTIRIARADYTGPWLSFLQDNEPFLADREIERLEMGLKHTGRAVHVAAGAGEFEIETVA